MTNPTTEQKNDRASATGATSDEAHESASVEEVTDKTNSSKSDFKSRIVSYTYSPLKPVESSSENMSSNTNDSVIPNPRKHAVDQTFKSTSNRTKRQATSAFASASPATSSPTPSKSAKSTSARKALRSTDPYSPTNNLVDSIRPGLMLLMIGLNPGLKTAETGHAYAHPSNLFWKLMHSSGLTARRHLPCETHDLMDLYSISNTNLCLRPTRDGAGLSKEELEAAVPVLEDKVSAHRPEVVCIVGKGIWETIVKVKVRKGAKKPAKNSFQYGWQDDVMWLGREVGEDGDGVSWPGARTFVTTSTSGLAANTKPEEKAAIWKELGDWIVAKRAEEMVKEKHDTGVEVKDEVEDGLS